MPIDPSPHGAEILHQPPQPKYPEPKPGQESDEPVHGQPGAKAGNGGRPALPDRPEQMAVDIEDEEADPVIDSGPGIDDDGLKSLRKQRG